MSRDHSTCTVNVDPKLSIVEIIELVDSVNRDDSGMPEMQYITIASISCVRYIFKYSKRRIPPSFSTSDFLSRI